MVGAPQMFLSFLIFVGASFFLINHIHWDYIGCTEPVTACWTPWGASWISVALGFRKRWHLSLPPPRDGCIYMAKSTVLCSQKARVQGRPFPLWGWVLQTLTTVSFSINVNNNCQVSSMSCERQYHKVHMW